MCEVYQSLYSCSVREQIGAKISNHIPLLLPSGAQAPIDGELLWCCGVS